MTGAFKGLGKLKLALYQLTTGKERDIHLVALGMVVMGMVVMGQTQSALLGRSFLQELGASDSGLSVLALAPRSITSTCGFCCACCGRKKSISHSCRLH